MEEAPFGGGAPNFVIFVDYYCAKIIAPRCAGGAPTDLQGGAPNLQQGVPKTHGWCSQPVRVCPQLPNYNLLINEIIVIDDIFRPCWENKCVLQK
jgi:hypothetical protein